MSSFLVRALRQAGYQPEVVAGGLVLIGDPGETVVVPSGSSAVSGYRKKLREWLQRATEPGNVILNIDEKLFRERLSAGYDETGARGQTFLGVAEGFEALRDLEQVTVKWGELQLIVVRLRSLESFLDALEQGFPPPAWLLQARDGCYEAAWYAFQTQRIMSIAERVRSIKKTVTAEEIAELASSRNWHHEVYDSVKSGRDGDSRDPVRPERYVEPETFENPFAKDARLLLVHCGYPAKSQAHFKKAAARVSLQRGTGIVAGLIDRQRARGQQQSPKKQASSKQNLVRAQQGRLAKQQQRIKRVEALMETHTQEAMASILGCDVRTIRRDMNTITATREGAR